MKKNISINLQGLIFHIEEDGFDVLSRYLAEVKAHFAGYRGHEDIVADIEGRIAELFAARLSPAQQVVTLADVEAMTAKMGRVRDFAADADADEDDEAPTAAAGPAGSFPTAGAAGIGGAAAAPTAEGPKRLYRDMANRKVAGVAAGIAQYFAVNPLWIRLGFVVLAFFSPGAWRVFDENPFRHFNFHFGSWALLGYIVLWIVLPKRYDAPAPTEALLTSGPLAGRRLFRDTDGGKVAGVASGLAAYFNIDVTLVRVLLLAGLLAGGFTFILYLILWVALPEAKTVSDKLRMRGDAINLESFDSSARNPAFSEAPTTTNRPVGAFLEGAARNARPAFSFLGTLIRWAVGGLLIFMGGSLLFSLFTALGVVAGLLPSASLTKGGGGIHFDEGSSAQNFAAVLHNVQPWAGAVALLAAGIPVLALVLLGLRLLLRRPVLGRTASLSLLGLWLVGVVGTAVAGGQLAREFRTQGSVVTTRTLAPVPGKGFVLAMRREDDNDFFEDVRLRLVPADSGRAPFIEQEVTARGISGAAARELATTSVHYALAQQDSVLTLDRGFTLTNDAPFRNQRLTLTLHLPLDKNYRLTRAFINRLDDDDFQGNRRPEGNEDHRARLLRSGRFQCLDCANATGNDDRADDQSSNDNRDGRDNSDSNSGLSLSYGGAPAFNTNLSGYGSARRSFDETGFTRVTVAGGYRVVVRRGENFKIEAGGDQDLLNDLRVARDGDELVLKPRNSSSSFFGRGWFRNGKKVLVVIDMPRVERLTLAGAVQADLGGFERQDELRVEQAGASHLRLNGNFGTLKLEQAGLCRTTATGHADVLNLDAAGACELAAANLQTRTATVSVAGACKARLHVTESIKGDAVGASEIAYSGQPRTADVDATGPSRVKRL